MSVYGSRRSRDRIAHVVLAVTALACGRRDASRSIDAPPAAVVRPDAPPVDAAPPEVDAAPEPVPVVTTMVAAGNSTCIVMSDLTVRCWGANSHGQLGDGTTADRATPVTPVIRAVKDLQLADSTACALLDDGSVACWGRIGWHGRAEDILRPTGVGGVIGVTQIFVLAGRACARLATGSLVCWGNVDARGHFAAGATNRAPTAVVGLDHIAGLRAEGAFSDDGRMWTWPRSGVPKRLDVAGVQEIGTREGTLCGRLQNGRVICAASERCGARPVPAAVAPPARPGKPKSKVTAAKAKSAAKPPNPTALAKPDTAAEPIDAVAFPTARKLAFDIGFCVVTSTNKLQCGDGCAQLDPSKLDRVDTVVGRCVVLKSGTVTCFDDGTSVTAPGVTRAGLLAAGRAHACAMVEGRIVCWGADDHHQLGDFAITR